MPKPQHHWIGEEPEPEVYFGFIYLISNSVNGRRYVGKKQYWMSSGKVKNRPTDRASDKWRDHHWKESNWASYTGSSKELNADIRKYGKDKFTFMIIRQCSSKGSLHYEEIKEQVLRDVLVEKLETGEYAYYNKQIAAIKFRPPENHSEETKQKIRDKFVIDGHPMLGKEHPNKGKKLPQTAPKRCKAKHSFHITNGKENKWWEDESTIPEGWSKGITRKDKGRKLSDKELEARKYAANKSKEKAKEAAATKAGFDSYSELKAFIQSSNKTKADLSRQLNLGWNVIAKISKDTEECLD